MSKPVLPSRLFWLMIMATLGHAASDSTRKHIRRHPIRQKPALGPGAGYTFFSSPIHFSSEALVPSAPRSRSQETEWFTWLENSGVFCRVLGGKNWCCIFAWQRETPRSNRLRSCAFHKTVNIGRIIPRFRLRAICLPSETWKSKLAERGSTWLQWRGASNDCFISCLFLISGRCLKHKTFKSKASHETGTKQNTL